MLVNQMTINPKIGLDIFWIFGFCGSQIFWILDSQMLTIEKPEDRARPGRATDNCICATGVVRALCCSEEGPGYCQLNVVQVLQVGCK